MLDTSARLLRLLSLLPTRAAWTGPELAERLDVTGRTLRRDIARLRELGYPVQATPGVAGGYRMGAGSVLPPLLLEDDEAVAVVLSLRTAAGSAGPAETAAAALAKLERILPARLRRRAAALRQATVPLPGGAPAVGAEVLTVLAEACQERQVLAFGYRGRDGAVTGRHVEPHRLVHAGRRWYLVARDRDRDAWRTFRADRIEDVRRAGMGFVPVDPPDAAAFVAEAVTTAPYPVRARVLVHAPAEVVAAQVPPSAGVVEAVSAGTCLLLTGAHTPGHIALHLALLGHPFTVLEPADLIGELAVLADHLAAAHRASVAAEG
ncbi:helix-turn-helix transcriptional regulator [Catellatospora bangladeshensis]|uniref:DeoR family transcriptional regulator n=2 Tax=Catellatospora bangladeshensis TaxID=310355 RepID=A0A8J3JKE6_9ACTN|nr:WYL domain-containing protein [Catellatospora bangladeshensis]GIF80253.1 DeoR family transcriptional regulator [Catellatospora bangladeshensis]